MAVIPVRLVFLPARAAHVTPPRAVANRILVSWPRTLKTDQNHCVTRQRSLAPMTAVFTPASSSSLSEPTVTGPSTQLDTTSLQSVFTDPILPTETGPSTFNPHFGPGLPLPPTKPAKPTKPTKPTQRPQEPGCSDSASHKPYPTGTYIGLWDPTVEGLPTTPISTTGPYRPGFDHSLAHQPFPTTAVLKNRNAEEATTRPYRPGFDHSLAHLPFPTTLATVVVENRNAEEEATTSARHIGPGWSHTIAWRPFPTSEEAAS
ncbi:MAG: hypothetical protein LQ339_000598 [Xanthoria mediterranea]|nr:MAG: hypothetical protein LQ339_000598 [Xanthoria mediterranea]